MSKNLYVDVHVIQTVPPSNVNRDDTGSPKSAVFGGLRRARVSSQAWKRATRVAFAEMLDMSDLGVRTKRAAELVAEEIARVRPDLADQAPALGGDVLKDAGIKLAKSKQSDRQAEDSGYLLFLANRQIGKLAELAIRKADGEDVAKSEVRAVLAGGNSIDLALFGRMVADVSDLSVDAAARVAHAISVHPVEAEYDFFTAVDEVKARSGNDEDAGAGMIGTVEFNSSTLYRYATVSVGELFANLGDHDAVIRAVAVFVEAYVRSMPTGKVNTFANLTLPDVILVRTRTDQPVSLVGAFETPPRMIAGGGWVAAAADALARYCREIDRLYGDGEGVTMLTARSDVSEAFDLLAESRSLTESITATTESVRCYLQEHV
jgi:CRISPR system Cascade subunit CasC